MAHFKCCKKNFANFCCIECLGVFHPTCLERKKGHIKLADYRILCSSECREANLKPDDRRGNHEREQDGLGDESLDTDLGNFDMEQSDSKQIREQDTPISELGKRVSLLRDRVAELEGELRISREQAEKIVTEKDELEKLQRTMLTSIEVLSKENKLYRDGVRELDGQGFHLVNTRNSGGESPGDSEANREWVVTDGGGKNTTGGENGGASGRLLILCDQLGYKLNTILRTKLRTYSIQTIIKPYACYSDVVVDLVKLTADFTKADFVLILAGANDFKSRKYPLFRDLNSKVKYCTHTNILLASTPFFSDSLRLNGHVHRFNSRLKGYAERLDSFAEAQVSFIEVNDQSAGAMFNRHEAARRIVRGVLHRKVYGKNLKFVTTGVNSNTAASMTTTAVSLGDITGQTGNTENISFLPPTSSPIQGT